MQFERLEFSLHAISRMAERNISVSDVLAAIESGEVVEEYPDDIPYPSVLLLGYSGSWPIHIVVAADRVQNLGIVVTVYRPNPLEWEPGLRKRRSQ